MNHTMRRALIFLGALSSWALVAAAAQSKGAFPNPVQIAPKIGKVWNESLDTTRTLQWTEKAVLTLEKLDRVTELSTNRIVASGKVSRTIEESEVHGRHRTGMKRRIRDNIALLSRDAIATASQFIANYAFPSESQMRDCVARSAIVISDVPGLQGDWELTTRNAFRDDDILTQWIQPESGRVLKMRYQSWIDDEPVKAETLYQVLPDGSDVPRMTIMNYVESDMTIRIEYSNYAKQKAPN